MVSKKIKINENLQSKVVSEKATTKSSFDNRYLITFFVQHSEKHDLHQCREEFLVDNEQIRKKKFREINDTEKFRNLRCRRCGRSQHTGPCPPRR